MIILPDKNIPRAKFLMPVSEKEWREPSLFVPKDQMGNDVIKTRFYIKAKSNDGVVVWKGWFDSREDFDAFLWAIALGTLKQESALWDLPTPNWQPYLGELITYEFATTTAYTGSPGSNQTWTAPSDWDSSNNSIECIGGAGGGSAAAPISGVGSGGGGGAYSKITNFTATAGVTTATYRVGAGGAAITVTAITAGNSGGATWFNSTTDPGNGSDNSKVSAYLGAAGGTAANSGGAGGATTSSWGQTKYAGGRGGNGGSAGVASGGGGAGGNTAAGSNGVDTNSLQVATNGGAGGATNGGSAGTTPGGNGGNGTNFNASYGAGGGGAGRVGSTTAAGSGGNYGGGGGGTTNSGANSRTSGAGIQGLIFITYEPLQINSFPNLAMMGM